MKKVIFERDVRRAVKDWLFRNGWNWNYTEKETREKGVDIRVQDGRDKKHARYFYIEVKGESAAKSARSVSETSFVYVLGQIVTRMKVVAKHAYLYGIALPESSARIAVRRIPWKVAKYLTLYVFSVNSAGKTKRYSWKDLKQIQVNDKYTRKTV